MKIVYLLSKLEELNPGVKFRIKNNCIITDATIRKIKVPGGFIQRKAGKNYILIPVKRRKFNYYLQWKIVNSFRVENPEKRFEKRFPLGLY